MVDFKRFAVWISLAALCAASVAMAQTGKDPLFASLAAAIEKARSEQVDVLAPTGFQAALVAEQSAQKDAAAGRKPDKIHAELVAGVNAINEASRAATSARKVLQDAISTRADAVAAGAPKFAPEQWPKAAARFNDAVVALERKDDANAQKRSAESIVLLRDAELVAIKTGLLGEARTLIAQADAAKVEKLAPRTLQAAKRNLAQAEQEISINRYDTSVAKNLAAEAAYEARHALYLAGVIGTTLQKQKDGGVEDLILSWEEPLGKVTGAMELTPKFDGGVQQTMQDLYARVQQQQQQARTLKQDLDDRNEQIAALNTQMQKLEAKLGGVSEERIALQRRVDAQERLRANVAKIEGLFSASEGRVYRQGDDVVISLTGIKFASGRSKLDAANVPLMSKVQQALAVFPDATMVVEGHTDANGTDSANLLLSQDRADAVSKYLTTNAGVSSTRISSIGYGEARPVATNETADGRARNRRIDLVVRVGAQG
ncbi:MAG TPA: OmpA family protein [Steroidobacteraceae bacterium]|jgi:outer membrane protein OmpA-like peptidoglycan-associated protein